MPNCIAGGQTYARVKYISSNGDNESQGGAGDIEIHTSANELIGIRFLASYDRMVRQQLTNVGKEEYAQKTISGEFFLTFTPEKFGGDVRIAKRRDHAFNFGIGCNYYQTIFEDLPTIENERLTQIGMMFQYAHGGFSTEFQFLTGADGSIKSAGTKGDFIASNEYRIGLMYAQNNFDIGLRFGWENSNYDLDEPHFCSREINRYGAELTARYKLDNLVFVVGSSLYAGEEKCEYSPPADPTHNTEEDLYRFTFFGGIDWRVDERWVLEVRSISVSEDIDADDAYDDTTSFFEIGAKYIF
jgi:hypothetical protein